MPNGKISYKSVSGKIEILNVKGKDIEELFANARALWEKAKQDPDEKKHPEENAKPNLEYL